MASESGSNEKMAEQQIVLEALHFLRHHKRYPSIDELKNQPSLTNDPPIKSRLLDRLIKQGFLRLRAHKFTPINRLEVTLAGLLNYGADEGRALIERFMRLLPTLEQASKELDKIWSSEDLASLAGENSFDVAFTLTLLAPDLKLADTYIQEKPELDLLSGIKFESEYAEFFGSKEIEPKKIIKRILEFGEEDGLGPSVQLSQLQVSGYRALEHFNAQLTPLTVIIGANGTGKSSLFDLLAFTSFAVENPIPPEFDPRSVGKSLFHLGGPESIRLRLHVLRGTARPLLYDLKLNGPIGRPQVISERLISLSRDADGKEKEAFTFLDFERGMGGVRSAWHLRTDKHAEEWTLPTNELALRRSLSPTLATVNEFREYVASWKLYPGFDVGMAAAIRRPVLVEPDPILREDGSNLSAVLFHLMTEHREAWGELETHLRSAIPSFQSLNVKSRGGPGTVMGIWREEGVNGELTLADLSDGTLKFLCWSTLCLSPNKPQLICIDEPELGLHPRVLPVLAGLMRQASTESQLIVATHSPYFLSQFSLEEIAVMKKEEGHAVFARPASNEALRHEIEELGTGELARLHINDELEVRS